MLNAMCLSSQHHTWVFHCPQIPCVSRFLSSLFPSGTADDHWSFYSYYSFAFSKCHKFHKWNHTVAFPDCFLSFRFMHLRDLHAFCGWIAHFFFMLNYILLSRCTAVAHSLSQEHLGHLCASFCGGKLFLIWS